MHELTQLSAQTLAANMAKGQFTAQEVLAAHKAQVEARNPQVNAFVTLDWEAAGQRATELDALHAEGKSAGPLHGVPIAIKDIFETKGLRTTWGSRSFKGHVPDYDALHVARLRAAGAVIIGKTNTPEFAFSGQTANLVAGTTRNPLNLGKTVAGSSGGAAAALAAHMVALADGSDLAGSTRTPAAWCGIVGYRPTPGLIPYYPNPVPFDGLSVPGPMARTVTDLVLMLSVMQGNADTQAIPYAYDWPCLTNLEMPLEAGKVALSLAPFGAAVDASVQDAVAQAAPLCRDLGWEVQENAPNLAPLMAHGDLIRGQSALHIRATLNPDMAVAGESFRTACAQAESKSLQDFIAYQATRTQVWQNVVAFFERYEFAIWPTATGLPFEADLPDHALPEDWRTVVLGPPMELPSITIPFGHSSDGMPVGLHITGKRGSDARLLRFARQIEQAKVII